MRRGRGTAAVPGLMKFCPLPFAVLFATGCAAPPAAAPGSEVVIQTETGYWLRLESGDDWAKRQRIRNIADRAFAQACSLVEARACGNPGDYFITVSLYGGPDEGCGGLMSPARREAENAENGARIQNAAFRCGPGDQVIIEAYSTQSRVDP